jgi:AraC-like DNA-binding protein
MSASDIILVVISGLGVIHGLFLAIFLWTYSKGHELSNKLLSVLLIILSFRIGKSVFLEFTDHTDIKIIFTGLSAIMAIGPVYFLFSKSCVEKSFRITKKHFIHFIPALVGFGFGLQLIESDWKTLPIMLFVIIFLGYYLHLLSYLIITYRYVIRERKNGLNERVFKLLQLLFFGLLGIWVVYVLNLFDEVVPYIVGPILYSLVAYVISFIVFKKGYIQEIDQKKYKTTPISDEQSDLLFNKVLRLIEDDELYRDSELNLKSLSLSLNVTPQVISMVINLKSAKNFNGFINGYRIDEAKRLLKDGKFENYTVSAIAYEVGFNSISSFNTAFKKMTNETPLAYRKTD